MECNIETASQKEFVKALSQHELYVKSDHAMGEEVTFKGTTPNPDLILRHLRFYHMDMVGWDVHGRDLSGSAIIDCDISGADFSDTLNNKTSYMYSRATKTDFTGVQGKETNFSHLAGDGAKFRRALLQQPDFSYSYGSNLSLTGSISEPTLDNVKFIGLNHDCPKEMLIIEHGTARHASIKSSYIHGNIDGLEAPYIDFSGSTLSGVCKGSNLRCGTLCGADITKLAMPSNILLQTKTDYPIYQFGPIGRENGMLAFNPVTQQVSVPGFADAIPLKQFHSQHGFRGSALMRAFGEAMEKLPKVTQKKHTTSR